MKKRDVHVQAFALRPDGLVDITYMEEREQSDVIGHAHTLLIDVASVPQELDDALDALQDIIDKGLLIIRNPPSRRDSGA